MTARTWLYNQLMVPLVEGRVFAKKSMTSSIEEHPYIVYKFGSNSPEALSETIDPTRQYIQVYVYDFADGLNADYMRIDEVIAQVKSALKLGHSAEDGVISVIYLETSQDLNDETLNAVMKYIRFQLILEDQS